jgi:hypothetical protein
MSNNPRSFAGFWPIARVWLAFAENHASVPIVLSSDDPLQKAVDVPALQAYSHSASVGRRIDVAERKL